MRIYGREHRRAARLKTLSVIPGKPIANLGIRADVSIAVGQLDLAILEAEQSLENLRALKVILESVYKNTAKP